MIDDSTDTGHWPLPHPNNLLSDDVLRIRAAFDAADADLARVRGAASSGLSDLAAVLAQQQAALTATDTLAKARVRSVNAQAGVDVTLLPEHLQLGPANGPREGGIEYDAQGRVLRITEQIGTDAAITGITYDAAGAVTQTQTIYHGHTRTTRYSYDAGGRVAGFTATETTP